MIDTGAYCEQIARDFLLDQGLVLIHSNYRCRYGEIDLIMLDKQLLVWVEVRMRSTGRFITAQHSVDQKKQRKLANTALYFLATHPEYRHCHCRFDVVAFSSKTGPPCWIKSAFTVT